MTAILSSDGKYRYSLTRAGDLLAGSKEGLLFLMLNPSTADANLDDNTIRRCKSFSSRLGYNGFTVANLYAFRATNPKSLWSESDPVGPENNSYLKEMANDSELIICAWGDEANEERVKDVCELLYEHRHKFKCFKINKSGMPRHPLYVRGDSNLIPWFFDSNVSVENR